MTGKHWLRVMILSAAATAAAPVITAWGQPVGGTGADSATDVAQRELQTLRNTLFDRDKPTRERDEAAKRLRERGAFNILQEALKSGRGDCQVPVARALAEVENPPPMLLGDLVQCLQPQMGVDAAEAISAALVNYRDYPVARGRLRDFVLNATASEPERVRVVRSLGSLSDKETAQFLVETMNDQRVTRGVNEAAADALGDMTGLSEYEHDVGQWERWWQAQARKSAEQFLGERRQERDVGARLALKRLSELAASIDKFVYDTHRAIKDDKERETFVLQCLKNPQPEFRVSGARMVNVAKNEGLPIADAVKERLRDLIGDSDKEVRRRVAAAIGAVNDQGAATALLAQLQREKIPVVRTAIIEALGPTNDVAAVPELLTALGDPSLNVAEAAATALAALGPEIAKNQVTVGKVTRALEASIDRTKELRSGYRLRERTVEAMVPLHNPDLVRPLFSLLSSTEANTTNVRRSAIQALAAMNVRRDTQADIANTIANTALVPSERDKGVRLEAARAMGVIGSPAQKQFLLNAMERDTDEDVKKAAWTSLSSLFPQFDQVSLSVLKETFKDAPERRLAVDLALNAKLLQAGLEDELAIVREDIGAIYLNHLAKPEEAITFLKQALGNWDAKPAGQARVPALQDNLLKAYVRAKRLPDAIEFAAERIKMNASNQEAVARVVLAEADKLADRNAVKEASELLTLAKGLQIKGSYGDMIDQQDKAMKARILPFNDTLADYWRGIVA